MIRTRFDGMFRRLAERGEGAFVPFLVLGDPDLEGSAWLLDALVAGGADGVELGLPFSDPIADGPVIQAAVTRALAGGGGERARAWCLVRDFRARHPDVPVGLLCYANPVVGAGLERFYGEAAEAGVDGVLVADVPGRESEPFVEAARGAGVAPVLMAPPGAGPSTVDLVAREGSGFTYGVARAGVTGTRADLDTNGLPPLDELARAGAPPTLLGFGISRPEHVAAALQAGAAGAISGSAVVAEAARHAELAGPEAVAAVTDLVARLKQASRVAEPVARGAHET